MKKKKLTRKQKKGIKMLMKLPPEERSTLIYKLITAIGFERLKATYED